MFPGIQGGFIGNAGALTAKANPLLDPRFKIQGGEPWNRTPLLPGKDTQQYEQQQFNIPMQPQLPSAAVGNVGGLLAQAKPTWQEIMDRGTRQSWTDIPGRARMRQDAMQAPYDPGNYAQNNRSNPLRNYNRPYGTLAPQQGIFMDPIRPYFGNLQGPGLQGELGTGAI